MEIYVIKQGDTISAIARQFGVTAEQIIRENELPNPENLLVGQSIVIRIPEVVHTVVQGDTLYAIAQEYGVNPNQILQNNPNIAAEETLTPGDVLMVSYQRGEPLGTVAINGYAYPFITLTNLRKTLPSLTYLSIFTYGFTPEGELIPIEDEELIEIANEFGVQPIMMLAPMDENGGFSSQTASAMFANPAGQAKLIENIVANMQAKGYVGLDIDFEFILPEDKENFIEFIRATQARLSQEGLLTFVALAPKTSPEQVGLLYEAHDYEEIGAIADYVLLMTYEWGYAFSSPMPTAPINSVRRVLDYGVTAINPDIILQGIPNYAYDWPLPYLKGETKATSMGNQEAIELAARYNTVIEFDELTQSPFFYYTNDEGIKHVVWFDDARSMNAKLRLMNEYKLAGGSIWQIMKFFPGLWLVMNDLYDIEKGE